MALIFFASCIAIGIFACVYRRNQIEKKNKRRRAHRRARMRLTESYSKNPIAAQAAAEALQNMNDPEEFGSDESDFW